MTLFLFPNALSSQAPSALWLSPAVYEAAAALDSIIAESPKAARLFFKHLSLQRQDLPLALYNKKTKASDLDFLLKPLEEGQKLGLISDAGLPCLADPGSLLVLKARSKGFPVQAFSGPCSITLSLILSGLPSQKFAFHGYLPQSLEQRKERFVALEKISRVEKRTEIFIEAPHHSQKCLEEMIRFLSPKTLLSLSCDLQSSSEFTLTKNIQDWKKSKLPDIHKKPCVFLFASS